MSAMSLNDSHAYTSPPVHYDAPHRDAILSVIECRTAIEILSGNVKKKAEVVDAIS